MFLLLQCRMFLRQLRKRDWLCLLLAITFLYNPFLAASASFGGLSVCHLPSFRATVAHSEFLKFLPKEKSDSIEVSECDLQGLPALPEPHLNTSIRPVDADEPVHPVYLPIGNSWFRPPPAA
jgi:hypothetical protein